MIKELLDNEYIYENEEYGFKVKNLTQEEQLELYQEIEGLKSNENNKEEINNDEVTFDMFKKFITSDGRIDFNKMDFEKFKILLHSDFTKDVVQDLIFHINILINKILKTALSSQILKLKELELQFIKLELQTTFADYSELITERIKKEKKFTKEKERIKKIKPMNFDEYNKVSWLAKKREKIRILKEIKKIEKEEK